MIEKFQSAEKAYQLTPFTGFRTFVKGSRGDTTFNHMPFFPKAQSCSSEGPFQRNMMIDSNEMEIEEIAPALGLKTNVLYFNLPNEEFPSLVRRTTFTNLDEDAVLTLDVLDGLDKLIPSGLSNTYMDAMGRLAEAYMNVYNAKGRNIREPFFHISQGTGDTAEIQIIKEGGWLLGACLAFPLPPLICLVAIVKVISWLLSWSRMQKPNRASLGWRVRYPSLLTPRWCSASTRPSLTPRASLASMPQTPQASPRPRK